MLAVVSLCLGLSLHAPRAEVAVGFAAPLSGPYAASGARSLIAVMTAVEGLNAAGGVLGEPVRLVVADDRCGIQEAVEAAEKLVRERVAIVVGHMCSHSSLVAAAVYDLADVLMITPDSTHPRLTEVDRPNVFRMTGRDDHQGAAAAALIADRWPDERVGVAHDGSAYGQTLAIATQRDLRRRGMEVDLFAEYAPGRADYGELVDEIADAGISTLYIAGYGPDAGRIVRDIGAAGLRVSAIGGDGLGMDEFWSTSQSAGEGTVFTTLDRSRAASSAGEAGPSELERDFAEGGLGAYAVVELWAEAAARAGSFDAKTTMAVLRRGRFETVRGMVEFDEKGDLKDARWVWYVWHDGRTHPLDAAPEG